MHQEAQRKTLWAKDGNGRRTERHLREEMMGDMIMGDIMQEIAAHPAKQRTIDRACRTAKEIPCTLAEVWEGRIRMLQLKKDFTTL